MQKIDKLKLQLQEAIQESDEYKEYMRLNQYINRNPGLRRQVDELRRENFLLQNTDGEEDMYEATDSLNRKYADLRNQNAVNQYLSAEICLCRMVQDICRSVADSVGLDMDFLTDESGE